jgi:putative endonuclease
MNSKQTGKNGELLAKNYLTSIGYQFIESNYHTRFGEIDLIFKDGEVLVLVEVKTRKGNQIFEIEETITPLKINRILKSAEIYIVQSDIQFSEIRVDAVFIKQSGKENSINHIRSFS